MIVLNYFKSIYPLVMKHANEHLLIKTYDFPSYYKLPFCSGISQLSTFDWQRISPIIPRDVPMISHFCWLIFIKHYLNLFEIIHISHICSFCSHPHHVKNAHRACRCIGRCLAWSQEVPRTAVNEIGSMGEQ